MVWLSKWCVLLAGRLFCGCISCSWREVVVTAIPKKFDKVGFRSMRKKFYNRALQTAVRCENKPHETNIILDYEPGRSTAVSLQQVLSKAAGWGVGAFVGEAGKHRRYRRIQWKFIMPKLAIRILEHVSVGVSVNVLVSPRYECHTCVTCSM